MTSSFQRFVLPVAAALSVAVSGFGADPAILAKARAYVGSEAALDGLKSIRYTGTLVTSDPADATKQTRAAMEIIFQKPDQQRVQATSDKVIDVTALDGYDGWQRTQDAADASKWQQTLLGSEQIKRLRANTWQNLSFYRGIERAGGRVEDKGPATIDGVACQKIEFVHFGNVVFTRYFETATGRLVFTETDGGNSTMRESGEIRVDGLRFPKTIVQTTKQPNGAARTTTITFDKITVNETFSPSMFRVPAIR